MRTPLTLIIIIAAVAAVAAACGGGSSGPGGTSGPEPPPVTAIDHPTGPTDILVDVHAGVGGFVPVEFAIGQRPVFRLYGDGTVIISGDVSNSFEILTYHLSEDGIQAVLSAARAAGLLDAVPDYGQPGITDVGSTIVELNAAGTTRVHDAYALGYEEETAAGLTGSQLDARRALKQFVDGVAALADEQPELLLDQPEELAPAAIEVHAWPASDPSQSEIVPWPLAEPLPGKATGDSLASGCLVVQGDDLNSFVEALTSTPEPILWRSGGEVWSAGYHVVLPGETPCAENQA